VNKTRQRHAVRLPSISASTRAAARLTPDAVTAASGAQHLQRAADDHECGRACVTLMEQDAAALKLEQFCAIGEVRQLRDAEAREQRQQRQKSPVVERARATPYPGRIGARARQRRRRALGRVGGDDLRIQLAQPLAQGPRDALLDRERRATALREQDAEAVALDEPGSVTGVRAITVAARVLSSSAISPSMLLRAERSEVSSPPPGSAVTASVVPI
jgi:hypothetical protein